MVMFMFVLEVQVTESPRRALTARRRLPSKRRTTSSSSLFPQRRPKENNIQPVAVAQTIHIAYSSLYIVTETPPRGRGS